MDIFGHFLSKKKEKIQKTTLLLGYYNQFSLINFFFKKLVSSVLLLFPVDGYITWYS